MHGGAVRFVKIPVYPNSINIRIKTSCKYDLTQYSIRESKILKIRNEWYVFITIERQDGPIIPPDNVLAVDLGCENIAVTVNTVNTKPNFSHVESRKPLDRQEYHIQVV
jgi:transposase